MSKNLFINQIHNMLFKNRNMYYLYLFCVFFSFTHFISQWGFLSFDKYNSIFYQLIGFNVFGVGTNIYVIFLPFISCFIGSGLLVENRKKKLDILIMSRLSKKEYISTSALSAFVIGSITGILPILFHTWVVLMLYPINGIDIYNSYLIFHYNSFIYNSSQIKMFFIYFIIWIIYSGTFSLIGFSISLYIKRDGAKVIPEVIHLFLWIILSRYNYLTNFNFHYILGGNGMSILNNSIKMSLLISGICILANIIIIRKKANENSNF